ncbi:MAG: hypothetical protein ABI868_09910 [Acidobacteriota bacterium]
MRRSDERGIAILTTLLVLMLMSALLVGFTVVVMSDQRYRFLDRDRGQSFYAAAGAIEKLTSDLGKLFFSNIAPTATEVTLLTSTAYKPTIAGVSYTSASNPTGLPASQLSPYHCATAGKFVKKVGGNGYTIMFCANVAGNPTLSDNPMTIKTGPFEGLMAYQTPYQLDVTARSATGGEVHLIRTMEAVAIPVFQFGMYSDVDLSFFAGPDFDFGGRVHTNGNLFLAQGDGAMLTMRDKVTAVKEVVREFLQNGVSIDTPSAHAGTVSIAKGPGCASPLNLNCRSLARDEGSVIGDLGSAINDPTFHDLSVSDYNLWLRNGRTGAKPLNLPLLTVGGSNPDLIRRPLPGENVANPVLLNERMFSKASLRILLSDTAADINGLPTVTATLPLALDNDWNTAPPPAINGVLYGPVDAAHPPIARTIGPLTTTVAASSTVNVINVGTTNGFRPPLRLNGIAVNCTTKTGVLFQGCTPGMPVTTFPVNVTAGPGISTATTASTTVASIQISVVSTTTFNPAPFWIGATLVSCTDYSASSFSNCSGLAAAPAAGAVVTTNSLSQPGTGLIGGFIKIEMQSTPGVWTDVTMPILNRGMGGPNPVGGGTPCVDPTPDAIVRIQRLRDNGGGACNYAAVTTGAKDASNWWPNVLFDAREGLLRDTNPGNTNVSLGGLMHYVAIDVENLSKWFQGAGNYAAGNNGLLAIKENGGFTVYFSDRRNNRNAANAETGEYGSEDFVNPAAANGAPNNVLDCGEDVNASSPLPGQPTTVNMCGRVVPATYVPVLDTYGSIPNYNGGSGILPPGAAAPLVAAAHPGTQLTRGQAQVNRAVLFRRALKLIRGQNIRSWGVTGLTVVSENPVYVQGDWNATGGSFAGAHAATSIIADAVTLLSNNWNDSVSFTNPYAPGNRNRGSQTWYRVAIIGGKGMAFPQPAGTATDFGTDGGAHNFLRYLEDGDQQVNYRGSIATFFYSRQALGTYKCCSTVYNAPDRDYDFDIDFLQPALLPPNTPVFRDMNAVGFSQELRPGR